MWLVRVAGIGVHIAGVGQSGPALEGRAVQKIRWNRQTSPVQSEPVALVRLFEEPVRFHFQNAKNQPRQFGSQICVTCSSSEPNRIR